jgi:hypothetical protein
MISETITRITAKAKLGAAACVKDPGYLTDLATALRYADGSSGSWPDANLVCGIAATVLQSMAGEIEAERCRLME